jgi:hypothetical protein
MIFYWPFSDDNVSMSARVSEKVDVRSNVSADFVKKTACIDLFPRQNYSRI